MCLVEEHSRNYSLLNSHFKSKRMSCKLLEENGDVTRIKLCGHPGEKNEIKNGKTTI